jgi:hypothetical protein
LYQFPRCGAWKAPGPWVERSAVARPAHSPDGNAFAHLDATQLRHKAAEARGESWDGAWARQALPLFADYQNTT